MPALPCANVLASLHAAIIDLQTGKRASTVSFGDRSATYTQTQFKELLALYGRYYDMCGEAEGYPQLTTQRGAPMRINLG